MEGPSCFLWMQSWAKCWKGWRLYVSWQSSDRQKPSWGGKGLVKVTAAQNGVSKAQWCSWPGYRTRGQYGGCISSHDVKAGGQPEDGNAESKMTNPLGVLSSFVLPACCSVLASLINSMPIFLLSHSSFLVLTFLTFICWFRVGFSLCFSLWRKQADIHGMWRRRGDTNWTWISESDSSFP